jgi:nucleotidyltransferase substrate binding protein (TIGR01987 family)
MNTDNQDKKPRWVYRFDNFRRALFLLNDAFEKRKEHELSQLEEEGIIQRFEYCWELSWKTMLDFLRENGTVLQSITPTYVIRGALFAEIIDNGEAWMSALSTRNEMSHTYNFAKFKEAIIKIESNYMPIFEAFEDKLMELRLDLDFNNE